ncbi:MAG TPA: hypothetical protein VM243_12850 [Phycisphaerae bacterium]|nr:hypothetical protein [Phycisphaerae bacterium]
MKTCSRTIVIAAAAAGVVLACSQTTRAWDEAGHSIVIDAALARLPDGQPAVLETEAARARLRFHASTPDRWRNVRLAPMGHINSPDHYFDVEWLACYGLTPETLPRYRNDFISHIVAFKAAHPDQDCAYEPDSDPQSSRRWPGFGPYRVCEMYVRLRSSWCTLNTYTKYAHLTAPGELEACRDDVLRQMGVLSHYVADLAQPLHTTVHYNGWIGDNPKGYTSDRGIHRLIDATVIAEAAMTAAHLPADVELPRIDRERLFEQVVAYVVESHSHVEELYALEKRQAFLAGGAEHARGCEFVKRRLARAAAMLAALWESAYRDAGTDTYREEVFQRAAGASGSSQH